MAIAGVMLLKGPHARRYTQNAVPTQGGAHKRWSIAIAGVMLFKGPQARWYTQNAVPTQGGAHKRRSIATAGVMLFKGPHTRWYTQKAVHTKGGLWPPQESCYFTGHRQGGTNRRRCPQKAVYSHRRSHVI